MKIDQEIFKTVFGKECDVNDEKDIMACISLHFWLNNFGVWTESRDYAYVLTDKGLLSCQGKQDVLNQLDDLNENQFSETTIKALSSLDIALESTAEIIKKPFDERDTIISSAVYKYIKTEYHLGQEEDEKKRHQSFKKHFSAGNYKLGKTCCEQAEIVYNSIIESKWQDNTKSQNTSEDPHLA